MRGQRRHSALRRGGGYWRPGMDKGQEKYEALFYQSKIDLCKRKTCRNSLNNRKYYWYVKGCMEEQEKKFFKHLVSWKKDEDRQGQQQHRQLEKENLDGYV